MISKEEFSKNLCVIPANDHHGVYIEDVDTGRSVCDFYFLDRLSNSSEKNFFAFENAQANAELFVQAPFLYRENKKLNNERREIRNRCAKVACEWAKSEGMSNEDIEELRVLILRCMD